MDRTLSPTDVFHDRSRWVEISREDAVTDPADRIVVVFGTSSEYAAWFDRDHPFQNGVGPHALSSVRYFRYQSETSREFAVTAGSAAADNVAPLRATALRKVPPLSTLTRSKPKAWIEIELVDEDGLPVEGERYTVETPDGDARHGTLDARGRARIDGIDPGTCTVCFPDRDGSVWDAA